MVCDCLWQLWLINLDSYIGLLEQILYYLQHLLGSTTMFRSLGIPIKRVHMKKASVLSESLLPDNTGKGGSFNHLVVSNSYHQAHQEVSVKQAGINLILT